MTETTDEPSVTAPLLGATPTLAERFEQWLFNRLPNLSPRLFEDPVCLTSDARRERVRGLFLTRGLEAAIAGRGPGGKTETFGDAYRRVYGRALDDAPTTAPTIDTALSQRCPHDGGYCHHRCERSCFRKQTGATLSSPHPGFPKETDRPVATDS